MKNPTDKRVVKTRKLIIETFKEMIIEMDYNEITIKELADRVDDEEFGILQLVKFQYEVLNYVDIVDESVEWRYVFVTDLNTSYSPKFNAYSISNGKSVEMKVHRAKPRKDKDVKTSFSEVPFEDGDILYVKAVKKQPKKQKIGDDFIEIPDVLEWWIKDYVKVM